MQNHKNLTTTIPTGSTSRSDRQQAAILVNKIFNGLKAIFPAWAAAIKDQDYQNQAKAEWLKGLIENRITTDYQIEAGFVKARAHNSPFLPSIGQFVQWCNDCHPTMEASYGELLKYMRGEITAHELHPLVYHTIYKNMDYYQFKRLPINDALNVFKFSYRATIEQITAGEPMLKAPPPAPQIEHDADRQASPEIVAAERAKMMEMLKSINTSLAPKTEAELADDEKLKRISENQ